METAWNWIFFLYIKPSREVQWCLWTTTNLIIFWYIEVPVFAVPFNKQHNELPLYSPDSEVIVLFLAMKKRINNALQGGIA